MQSSNILPQTHTIYLPPSAVHGQPTGPGQPQSGVSGSSGGEQQQGQTIIIHSAPGVGPTVYPNYNARYGRVLGWLQITMGILSTVINVIILSLPPGAVDYVYKQRDLPTHIGSGIWCGMFYIVAGTFTVSASKHKTMCLVIASLVLSILAVVFSFVELSLSFIGFLIDIGNFYYPGYSSDYTPHGFEAVPLILLLGALCEIITSIWSSVLVCKVACCGQPNTQAIYSQPQVVYLNTNPHAHPQLQAQGGELPPYQPVQAQPQLQPLPVVVLNPNPVCPTRLPAGDKEGQETDSTAVGASSTTPGSDEGRGNGKPSKGSKVAEDKQQLIAEED